MIFVKLAWRNIFRNTRRTVITGIAIGLGLASLIFVDALMRGMEKTMIRSVTTSFIGEAQIHKQGFRQSQEVADTINDLAGVTARLDQDSLVQNYSVRTLSLGMITSPANVDSIELIGIDPAREQYLSGFDDTIAQGTFFKGGDERDIVIGFKLAESLEAGIGDRVVVTVARAGSGDLSQEMFRIAGIYRFNTDELDKSIALVRLSKAQELLGIGGSAHEIAIKFTDLKYAQDARLPFWKAFSAEGNEALGWPQLMPELKAALDLSSFSILITAAILFGIIIFGIVNTLFMSLYERMFEFGVIRAVGTRPFGVARLIMYEAGALGIVSIGIGMLMALVITAIVSHTGIDYTGVEYSGVTFREPLYPILMLRQFIIYPVWVFVFTLVAGIYPAVYAARMSPIEAMRKSL